MNTTCDSSTYPNSPPIYPDYCQTQFCSRHEGGGFFLMCDGQVRFISENIDIATYRGLSTYDNNEVIDDEDF